MIIKLFSKEASEIIGEYKGECERCDTQNVLIKRGICRRCRLAEHNRLTR